MSPLPPPSLYYGMVACQVRAVEHHRIGAEVPGVLARLWHRAEVAEQLECVRVPSRVSVHGGCLHFRSELRPRPRAKRGRVSERPAKPTDRFGSLPAVFSSQAARFHGFAISRGTSSAVSLRCMVHREGQRGSRLRAYRGQIPRLPGAVFAFPGSIAWFRGPTFGRQSKRQKQTSSAYCHRVRVRVRVLG